MNKHTVAVLALLSAAPLADAALQWIGPFTVTRIEADANAVYFYKGDNFPNPDGCSGAAAVKFESSETLVDRAISIGLAAKAAGQQVRFFTNGCSTDNYIRAYSIEIQG